MPRLLTIEQEPILQDLERSFVRRQGFELETAHDGRELVDRARESNPDLVIAPTNLGELSGLAVCSLLRASPKTSAIPILVIGSESEREPATASGARAFLAAPWTTRELMGALRGFFPVEERGAERASISLRVLCDEGAGRFVAFTRDISASGVFLKGGSGSMPGTKIRLRFTLPVSPEDAQMDLWGEVVRRTEPDDDTGAVPGVGVRFIDLPLVRRVPITRFVREHSTG